MLKYVFFVAHEGGKISIPTLPDDVCVKLVDLEKGDHTSDLYPLLPPRNSDLGPTCMAMEPSPTTAGNVMDAFFGELNDLVR